MESREKQIEEIYKSVLQINEIHKDLQAIVRSQDVTVFAEKTEKTEELAEKGVKQIVKADSKKNSLCTIN